MSEKTDAGNGEVTDRVRRVAEFSLDQLNAHFREKGGLNQCEACGASDWNLSRDSQGRPSMVRNPLFDPTDSVLLFTPVFCGACGNTRFFNVAQVISAGSFSEDD